MVLCDVFMPGTDGLETLHALGREFPALPVVSMSGGGFGGRIDLLGAALHLVARRCCTSPSASRRCAGCSGEPSAPRAPARKRRPPAGRRPGPLRPPDTFATIS